MKMLRANVSNLRKEKTDLMSTWKLTDEQWKEFFNLATKKSWLDYHERGYHTSFGKRDYIQAISNTINGYGAESCYPELPDIHYVNMGDTYACTIILKGDKLYIGCWGDLFENC
jgi:hypothetical protein